MLLSGEKKPLSCIVGILMLKYNTPKKEGGIFSVEAEYCLLSSSVLAFMSKQKEFQLKWGILFKDNSQ